MPALREAAPSSDLLYLLYRATLDRSGLEEFLDLASLESHSHNTCLAIQNDRDVTRSRIIANEAGREAAKLYPAVADQNPYLEGCREYFHPGGVLRANTVLDERALVNSRFYEDYCREADIHHAMGINLRVDDGLLIGMSFNRSRKHPFTLEDQRWAEKLAPHLQTFFTTNERLAITNMSGDAAWAVLDMQHYGIQVYDERRRPVFSNQAIQALVEKSPLMRWRDGRIDPDQAKLSDWMDQCSRKLERSGTDAEPMVYTFEEGEERYHFMFAPLVMKDGYRERTFSVLVVTDLNDRTSSIGDRMTATYRLTRRESEVAMLLVQGLSTREISERLNVAESTVVTHKKSLFQKTEVHRQSELVRLALSFDIRH